MTRTLILGGARSSKSTHAQSIALESGCEVVYIASAARPHGSRSSSRRRCSMPGAPISSPRSIRPAALVAN